MSIFRFKENRGPVGTNYAKVIPAKEINFRDRDSFWKKEEEEERSRVEVEKVRRQQELLKGEEERRSREEKEHNERERKIAINDLKSPTNNVTPIKRYVIPCIHKLLTVQFNCHCVLMLVDAQN